MERQVTGSTEYLHPTPFGRASDQGRDQQEKLLGALIPFYHVPRSSR
jgi:hypothetical protein